MSRLVSLILFMVAGLSQTGCQNQDSYVPPDLVYLYRTYSVGKNPTSIKQGDFNEDGFADLITSNIRDNSLSLLLGNGDGSFQDQKVIPVCQEPRNLAIEDLNLDGHMDVVVACSGSNQVAVFVGTGSGSFSLMARYPVRRTPVSIAVGDYNEDQIPDFVAALRNDKLQIFLGMGTGKFRFGPLYEYGDTPTSVATADLNRDGHLDLAVTNGGPMSSAVSIWLGRGDGTFNEPTDYRTGKRPLSVSFADFNNDRILDLLVVNGEMNTISIFLGNGDGTFQEEKDVGGDAGPIDGLAQDFNGDGVPDLAIVNIQSGSVSLLFGKGDGTFYYPPRHYATPYGPFAITSLSVAADRHEAPGLAIANNAASSVSIFLHHGLRTRVSETAPVS